VGNHAYDKSEEIMNTNFKKILVTGVLLTAANLASAQTVNYYAPGQGLVGWSHTTGNVTNFYAPGRGLIGSAHR